MAVMVISDNRDTWVIEIVDGIFRGDRWPCTDPQDAQQYATAQLGGLGPYVIRPMTDEELAAYNKP